MPRLVGGTQGGGVGDITSWSPPYPVSLRRAPAARTAGTAAQGGPAALGGAGGAAPSAGTSPHPAGCCSDGPGDPTPIKGFQDKPWPLAPCWVGKLRHKAGAGGVSFCFFNILMPSNEQAAAPCSAWGGGVPMSAPLSTWPAGPSSSSPCRKCLETQLKSKGEGGTRGWWGDRDPPIGSYGSLEAPLARGALPAPPVLRGHKWGREVNGSVTARGHEDRTSGPQVAAQELGGGGVTHSLRWGPKHIWTQVT